MLHILRPGTVVDHTSSFVSRAWQISLEQARTLVQPATMSPPQLPIQTYPGQTYSAPAYPGQVYPGHCGQTYPAQVVYPGQAYAGQVYPGQTYRQTRVVYPGQPFIGGQQPQYGKSTLMTTATLAYKLQLLTEFKLSNLTNRTLAGMLYTNHLIWLVSCTFLTSPDNSDHLPPSSFLFPEQN